MKRFFTQMNPTVRGLLIIALVVVVIMLLNLEGTLVALSMILRIAFFLAIAFFLFLMWRERRDDIEGWSQRSRWAFYGAALLIVVNLGAAFATGFPAGLGALAFVLVFGICGFAMFRIWRDEHTYS